MEFARSWDSAKPTKKIHRILGWYTRHDKTVISLLRGFVAVLPSILIRYDIGIGWVALAVIIGLYVTETLARKRESLKQAKWMEEAYDVHKQIERDERDRDPTVF